MKFIFIAFTALLLKVETASAIASFGHNLAASTDSLAQGEATVGTYAIAYGITDNLTIATSPWMEFGYDSDNLILRTRHVLNDTDTLGNQLAFLKTDKRIGTEYDQEVLMYWLTWARKFQPYYTFNISLNYMYFWDEGAPFSLRREPYNNDAYQLSISTLHQFFITKHLMNQLEVGVLGLNYLFPYLQLGASVVFLYDPVSIQLGFSTSWLPSWDWNNIPSASPSKPTLGGENTDLISLHPEIQLQYWF